MVVVLELADLISVHATQQSYSLAVLDNGRDKLGLVVVAHLPSVVEDGTVSRRAASACL